MADFASKYLVFLSVWQAVQLSLNQEGTAVENSVQNCESVDTECCPWRIQI
jgi:hypothetical protein